MTIEPTILEKPSTITQRLRVVTVSGIVDTMVGTFRAHELARQVFWDLDDQCRPLFQLRDVTRQRERVRELVIQWAGPTGEPDLRDFPVTEQRLSERTLVIAPGSRWAFDLLAHPTKAGRRAIRDARGQVASIEDEEQKRQWLRAKLPSCDVSIQSMELEDVPSAPRPYHRSTRFVGQITANDPAELVHALSHGVGKGRSAGLGMMRIRQL